MTDDIVARLRGTIPSIYDARDAADEITRLRAELANARERKPIVYSPDAQAMSDRVKSAEAERDALRAELTSAKDVLKEARLYVESFQGQWGGKLAIQIDAVLAKDEGHT